MGYFFEHFLNGLSLGSIYALVALGYSMVYGIVKLINFAHGDIIMVGGYAMFTMLVLQNAPVPVAMLFSILFCALLGIVIYQIAYKRLLSKGVPKITLLITAIGVSLFLQNLFQVIYGSESKTLPATMVLPTIHIGSIVVESSTFLTILIAVLMMIGLYFLVNKTKMGKAMRATSEDMGAAELMGINSNRVIAFTFAIGSALACVAAILYVNRYPNIRPTMGSMLGLKAFIAAVLGGIGNIPGAMLGGFLLGLLESLINGYSPNTRVTEAVVFAVLIIILTVKPAGLLGKTTKEKV